MILGIETSCDETAVAIVNDEYQIISQILTRQAVHEKWGGIVPESASRAHLELLDYSVQKVFENSNTHLNQIKAIAVTTGPGLAGALWVGVSYALGLCEALNIPIIPIHHLEAHLWTVKLIDTNLKPPFIALLVSGGHTLLLHVHSYRNYQVIGKTKDDSIGEAFDKAARMLQLGYPGGPAIEKHANIFDSNRSVQLPITNLSDSYDFSFSGLKTALKIAIDKNPKITTQEWANVFQEAAILSLLKPVIRYWNENPHLPLIVSGGVAANEFLRKKLQQIAITNSRKLYATPLPYCTDNGVMIAIAGVEWLKNFPVKCDQEITVKPRWSIEELNNK
ncbi:MAG: tRNA (adenosine(37)-N6)-threonylcarbamoyltransferase complex transferase subunit TsaD [bacterium]|nr:tRNA (adenosine(37)-N6)-threonylcarbamoyltransferase complex transferase subunit TsaD [bacterium]